MLNKAPTIQAPAVIYTGSVAALDMMEPNIFRNIPVMIIKETGNTFESALRYCLSVILEPLFSFDFTYGSSEVVFILYTYNFSTAHMY